ncbi:hypothetical protein JW826_00530 [Candidatus Woesearchaeota archaeon]|nr:hypothetical protein [Candidatus Woesearchaeota archaeon]
MRTAFPSEDGWCGCTGKAFGLGLDGLGEKDPSKRLFHDDCCLNFFSTSVADSPVAREAEDAADPAFAGLSDFEISFLENKRRRSRRTVLG